MRVPVIRGEYGVDTFVPLASRPDPWAEPREKPVSFDKPALLKYLGWTEANFQTALAIDGPNRVPAGAKRLGLGSGWELVWRKEAIDAWIAGVREAAGAMLALIANARVTGRR